MMRTSNPMLGDKAFSGAEGVVSANPMTIQGTINKTIIMLVLMLMSASWAVGSSSSMMGLFFPALIGGFVVALVTAFKKEWSPITAPIYALIQGVVVGVISIMTEKAYPGVVSQAVGLTMATLFALLTAYKTGFVKVTDKFRLGVVAATGGIALFYFATFILSMFNVNIPLFQGSGMLSIGFSAVVVIVAALNLVLDFDFIDRNAKNGAPKYMEWYAAFGLMVTLIWLYLEILRLLSKMKER